MPFKDLREFLALLEEKGELLRTKKPVDVKFEISSYIRKTSDEHGPALLFENVNNFNMPVLGGLLGRLDPSSLTNDAYLLRLTAQDTSTLVQTFFDLYNTRDFDRGEKLVAEALQAHVKPGDFVVCDQLVDRTRDRANTFYDGPVTTHISFADPYCVTMREVAVAQGRKLGIPLHERGTVVVIEGAVTVTELAFA